MFASQKAWGVLSSKPGPRKQREEKGRKQPQQSFLWKNCSPCSALPSLSFPKHACTSHSRQCGERECAWQSQWVVVAIPAIHLLPGDSGWTSYLCHLSFLIWKVIPFARIKQDSTCKLPGPQKPLNKCYLLLQSCSSLFHVPPPIITKIATFGTDT